MLASHTPSKKVFEKPVHRGMGFQPMNHRQDADATKSHGQMPVPLFKHLLTE
jgi:hypothetical protein